MKHDTTKCPHCGQRMLMRFGERFTPQQADILGMIEDVTKGRGGIDGDSLSWVFFPGVSSRLAKQRIKTVVCEINNKLASTEWRIINVNHYRPHGAFYQLKKVTASEMKARKWVA